MTHQNITPSHDVHPLRMKVAVVSLRILVCLTLLAALAMIFGAFGYLVAKADGQTPKPQVAAPANVPVLYAGDVSGNASVPVILHACMDTSDLGPPWFPKITRARQKAAKKRLAECESQPKATCPDGYVGGDLQGPRAGYMNRCWPRPKAKPLPPLAAPNYQAAPNMTDAVTRASSKEPPCKTGFHRASPVEPCLRSLGKLDGCNEAQQYESGLITSTALPCGSILPTPSTAPTEASFATHSTWDNGIVTIVAKEAGFNNLRVIHPDGSATVYHFEHGRLQYSEEIAAPGMQVKATEPAKPDWVLPKDGQCPTGYGWGTGINDHSKCWRVK